MAKTKWKKRRSEGGFWDPEEGEEIVGVLEAIRTGSWDRNIYDLRVGEKIVTVPGSAVLKDMITMKDIDKKLRIVFNGWGQGKGGKYRKFKVFDVDEGNEKPGTD